MIEIIREAELACTTQPKPLNGQTRSNRHRDDDDEWRRLMGMIAAGDAAWWDARRKWLQTVRQYLQREMQRYDAPRQSASSLPQR